MLQTRWYLIRPPSLACTCRNEMSWLSVAAYSFTGTLTNPKDTAPFQMARMGSSDRYVVVSIHHDVRHPPGEGSGGGSRYVRMSPCVRCSPRRAPACLRAASGCTR